MQTLADIEGAISLLSNEDIRSFRKWFIDFDNKEWDNEIFNDQQSGKLDDLISSALSDYRSGNVRKI